LLKGSSKSSSAAELQQAHSFWVNRETRRRLLLGSFILDTQQAVLFEQQSVLFPRWPGETSSTHTSTLPFPCDDELWECRSVEDWAELAAPNQHTNLSAAAESIAYDNATSLDSFRARLIVAYLCTHQSRNVTDAGLELAAFGENLNKDDPVGRHIHTKFDIHAHTAAQNTPLRSLLIVSGESWLFGKKLEKEHDFHTAKARLREWVSSKQAEVALWHATQLLRLVFHVESQEVVMSPPAADEMGSQDREMKLLHEQWCIYLAALICWACAFNENETPASSSFTSPPPPPPPPPPNPSTSSIIEDPTSVSGTTTPSTLTSSSARGYPLLLDPMEADAELHHFLQTTTITDVDAVGALPAALAARVRGQSQTVRGLLEAVRTRKISGPLGGLLNEATAVLHRLVEGRSRLSWF
jgi:Fungal specific transcription factor domain